MGSLKEEILKSLHENYVPPGAPAYSEAMEGARAFENFFRKDRKQAVDLLLGCGGDKYSKFRGVELIEPHKPPEAFPEYKDVPSMLGESGQKFAVPVLRIKKSWRVRTRGVMLHIPFEYSGSAAIVFTRTSRSGLGRRMTAKKRRAVTLLHECAHASYKIGSRELDRLAALESHSSMDGSYPYVCLLRGELGLVDELNSRRITFYFGSSPWWRSWPSDDIYTLMYRCYFRNLKREMRRDSEYEKYKAEFDSGLDKISERLSDAVMAMDHLENAAASQGLTKKHITKLVYAAGPTPDELKDAAAIEKIYSEPAGSRLLSPLEYISAAADMVRRGELAPDEIDRAATGNKNRRLENHSFL